MKLNFKLFSLTACILLLSFASLSAKVIPSKVYMFGFAASFTDSVAYVTGIQEVDNVYLDGKTQFLMDRAVYSNQLQSFLERDKGAMNMTCAVFYNVKKKKLQEELARIRKRYEKTDAVRVQSLEGGPFRFEACEYVETVVREQVKPVAGPKGKKNKKRK